MPFHPTLITKSDSLSTTSCVVWANQGMLGPNLIPPIKKLTSILSFVAA